ncbi:MAG: hypothetical protein KDB79_14430 [Acidobacteria bacterium]|nr:hypothetical protein [Acidobacteriota bacterium]
MKTKKLFFLAAFIGSFVLLTVSAFGQVKFSDPNVEYEFILPDEAWKMTVKPSEYSPNVEYVYKYKQDGHLQIRKSDVKKDDTFTDIIREEEQKLQFIPGYVAGKEENFTGALEGKVFNYEFVRSGQTMGGRTYFLRASPTTVYVVRFTGIKDKLRTIRNQTDYIARTFAIK